MTSNSPILPGISEEEIENVRQPLENAYTLPKTAYTSDDIYDIEVQRILRRSWIPLARVEQIPEKGSYTTLDLLGQPVMIVHGHDGEIRVMSSICLHRGAPVAQGCGKRALFTCPYHAWSYDTAGQLHRAPLMEGVEGFDEKLLKLPQISTVVWEGFVLANLDSEAAPFEPQVAEFSEYFSAFKFGEMVIAKTLEFESGWNWKVLVENFMEAYHHIAIHSKTFEPNYHARDSLVPDNSGPWSILHMPSTGEDSSPGLPSVEGLAEWQAKDLFASVIFPYFLLGVQGSGVAWYQVIPRAVDRLHLKIHLLVPEASLELPDFDHGLENLAATVSLIHQEDIRANDLVWDGLSAPLTQQGRLSSFEKSIWQLNQWWLDQMLVRDN